MSEISILGGDIFLFGPQGGAWGASSCQLAAGRLMTQRRRMTWEPQWSEASFSVWPLGLADPSNEAFKAADSAGFQRLRKPRRQAWYRPAFLTDTRSDVSQTLNAAFPPTGAAQGKAADMSLGNKKSDLSQLNVALSGASLPAKERMPPVINWNWVWKPSRMRLCCCQKDLWLHLLLEPPSWNNTDHQAADPAPPPTACPLNKFHFHHSQSS